MKRARSKSSSALLSTGPISKIVPAWSWELPGNFFRIENSETRSKNLEAFRVSSPTTPPM